MSREFERELKGILSGDEKWFEKALHSCPVDALRAYRSIRGKPFLVIRAAGSLGVDLVAIRGDVAFPIEVKSSHSRIIRFSASSGQGSKQAAELIGHCHRAGLVPLYAYKLKHVRGEDPWRVFTVDIEGVEGTLRYVHSLLPKMSESRVGHFIMRWDDGLPLHKFIAYLMHER
ncbi:MAG: Holliday junction resolvase [Candidatus Thermoplasmatota archaeon]